MQSNTSTDVRRDVTEQDVLRALMSLGSLPKRRSEDPEMDLAAYRVALDRTHVGDLAGAIRSILQGALGHAFFPSPPELRIECDKQADGRAKVVARKMRRLRELEERAQYPAVEHSDEAKARVAAIYRRFNEQRETVSAEDELAAIRAKYDPAALEKIPDRPADATWQVPRGVLSVKMMAA